MMTETEIQQLRRRIADLEAEIEGLRRLPAHSPADPHAQRRAAGFEDGAEADLRRSEALLKATQRISKVGGWEWDVESQTMFWTEEAYRIHDLDPDEITPGSPEHIDSSLACYAPEDRAVILEAFRRCAEHGEPYDLEFPFRTARGRRLFIRTTAQPVFRAGRVVRVIGNIMDLTDRKRDQEQLAESERRLSMLMANLPGMAYRCLNDESWTMKFVSEGCIALTGCLPDHLLDNRRIRFSDLIHPEDRQMVRDQVKAGLDRCRQFNITYRIRCADGAEKWVMEMGQGVFLASGELLALEGFITDITERIRAEQEKSRLEDQNRQLQKAESLGRMAGAIAHRFNNLLGVVLGNLEMAVSGAEPEAFAMENLTEAMQAARRAAEVSGLMLTYLGQTRTRADRIDLAEACRRNLQPLQAVMPKDVLLESDIPERGPVIKAGAHQIQQVLVNLCTNAWEAIGSSRGTIRLSVQVVGAEKIPAVNRFPLDWHPQESAYACLEVADSGCGIAGKDIEKLFDPFFSSKFTGRGLGLPVVLGVVKAYRGAVAVESKPGKGSVFRVYFPLTSEAVPLQTSKADEIFIAEKGGTILLVEDEDMLRKLTHAVLKGLGFEVVAANDGAMAVELFLKHQGEIRLVICDLTMPGMDGWETLDALRRRSPDLPVILTSGFAESEVMAGDHITLPNAFLGKPYHRDELINTIAQVLTPAVRPAPRS